MARPVAVLQLCGASAQLWNYNNDQVLVYIPCRTPAQAARLLQEAQAWCDRLGFQLHAPILRGGPVVPGVVL